MSSGIRKTKGAIVQIERQRKELLDILFSDDELIVGSFCEVQVRCGKQGCHCEKKPAHLVTRLASMEKGKLKMQLVRIEDRQWVSTGVKAYKDNKKAIGEITSLNKKLSVLLKTLIKERNCRYE